MPHLWCSGREAGTKFGEYPAGKAQEPNGADRKPQRSVGSWDFCAWSMETWSCLHVTATFNDRIVMEGTWKVEAAELLPRPLVIIEPHAAKSKCFRVLVALEMIGNV